MVNQWMEQRIVSSVLFRAALLIIGVLNVVLGFYAALTGMRTGLFNIVIGTGMLLYIWVMLR